jgi:hypothetical protein
MIPGTLILLLMAACGCGGTADGLRRVAVEGAVVRDGTPVPHGSVAFVPGENVRGPAASTAIVSGRYEFTSENGPVAGPHTVIVTSMPPKDELMKAQHAGQTPQTRWEFTVTVPEADTCEFDLDLNAANTASPETAP